MKLAVLSLGVCLLMAWPPSFAQNIDLMDMSIEELLNLRVESASKSAMSSEDAPGIVTVITRDDIRNYGLETLADVLNLVPGFTVGRSLQSASHNTYYVRGSFSLYSETVLVLKNGHRLNDALTGGAVTFSPDYPLNQVKQIEIIRGPGSALYGANAFVALINIITDESELKGIRTDISAGEAGVLNAFIAYGGTLAGGDLSISSSYQHREFEGLKNQPFTRYASPNPPPFPIGISFNRVFEDMVTDDQTEGWVSSLTWRKGGLKLLFDYEEKRDANNWGAGIPDQPSVESTGTYDLGEDRYRNHDSGTVYRLGFDYDKTLNEQLSLNIQGNYASASQETFFAWTNLSHLITTGGEGHLSGFMSNRDTDSLNADLSFNWTPQAGHLLVAGYSYQSDNIAREDNTENRGPQVNGAVTTITPFRPNGDYLEAGDRQVHALFAQYNWEINKKFALTAGVRGDDYSDFGSTVNPRLALVASPFEKLSIKALYGQAFRAPTFLETNYSLNGGIKPNPDLKPEEIKTTELQFLFKPTPNLHVDISGFDYEITDVIRQVRTGASLTETQSQNQGMRSGKGIDFVFLYQTSLDNKLFLNYSRVDPTETTLVNGLELEDDVAGVPKDAVNLGISWSFKKRVQLGLSVSRRWNWTPQQAIHLPNIELPGYSVQVDYLDQLDLPNYTLVDATFALLEIMPGANLRLNLDNIFDEQMHFADQHLFAPGGITSGGRNIKLGLSWRSQN